jgi:glycosyltransferase involved in cell wall biosynthesis
MKLIIFSHQRNDGKRAGREMLSESNSAILQNLFPGDTISIRLRQPAARNIVEKFAALRGWIDGLNRETCSDAVDRVRRDAIDIVYIDGSNYGIMAKALKRANAGCLIVAFFHNVEAKFFWDAFKTRPTLKALAVCFANFLAEKQAVKHSDRLICLNKRDSLLLKRLYGRSATDILPMYIQKTDEQTLDPRRVSEEYEDYALFVGGAFYANVSGVRWFAQHVAPYLNRRVVVVGQGFEKYREELELHANISVIGSVESVDEWYSAASFVIAPIFDGSGMKTKVAEAMMYGKPILATPEAFIGYEDVASDVGVVCRTAEEFMRASNAFDNSICSFEPARIRHLFEEHYSVDAASKRFEALLAALATQQDVHSPKKGSGKARL